MATRFFLRNATVGIPVYTRLADQNRGGSVATLPVTTASGGTWLSFGFFVTKPLVAFTLSQSVSFNLWGYEAGVNDNATLAMRLYKLSNNVLSSQIMQLQNTTELGTGTSVRTASGTPTSTSFLTGDSLVFEIGTLPNGTYGSGNAYFTFNGGSSGLDGDSFITLTDDTSLENRFRTTT